MTHKKLADQLHISESDLTKEHLQELMRALFEYDAEVSTRECEEIICEGEEAMIAYLLEPYHSPQTTAHPETQKFLTEVQAWLENDEPFLDLIAMAEAWREAGCPNSNHKSKEA